MSRTLASTLSLCCLTLLLPCSNPVWAEEAAAAPPADAAPAAVEPSAEAPGEPPSEHAAVPERSENEAQGLQQQLPNAEQQQLAAGDGHFLALWKPANAAEASGVVILIPGDSENADWPQAIGPLRNKLPDVGWSSLSLTLPDPHDQAPQIAPAVIPDAAPATEAAVDGKADSAAPASDPAQAADAAAAAEPSDTTAPQASAAPEAGPLTQVSPEQHAERVLARIQAAIAFAQTQKPKRIVLLGHGSGSYWAARYLGNNPSAEVRNLLLVAPGVPEGFSPSLEELLPGLKLAIGDFYYKDQPADRTAALKRQQASKRQAQPAYVQVAMKALPGNPATEQEQLFRRIRGWLSLDVKAPAAQ